MGQSFIVKVERVELDALYLPDALVTVSNLTGQNFSFVMVECRFLDKAGALIDVGKGLVDDLAAGASQSSHIQSAAQYQKPASADCRASSTH